MKCKKRKYKRSEKGFGVNNATLKQLSGRWTNGQFEDGHMDMSKNNLKTIIFYNHFR